MSQFISVSGGYSPVDSLLRLAASEENYATKLHYDRRRDPWQLCERIEAQRTMARKRAALWLQAAELAENGMDYGHVTREILRLF